MTYSYDPDGKIEKYLDELAEEYKNLLLLELMESSDPLEKPSVSDLLRLDSQIKKPLYSNYKRTIRKRRLFFSIGITYVCLGFILFLAFWLINGDYKRPLDLVSLMSIVISIIGVLVSIFSFTLPFSTRRNAKRNSKSSMDTLKYESITKWRDIEGIVRDLSSTYQGISNFRSIIDFLYQSELIDDEEQKTLKKLLRIRNESVHESESTYSFEEILSTLDATDRIVKRIREII